MIYRLDHYYAIDHDEFCLLVESEKGVREMIELTSAITFLFEEIIDESECLSQPCLLMILRDFFGIKDVKEKYKECIPICKPNGNEWNNCFNKKLIDKDTNFHITQIDLYEAREFCCGKNYRKLMNKYLPKNQELVKLKETVINNWRE